jgi:hypothetical protein
MKPRPSPIVTTPQSAQKSLANRVDKQPPHSAPAKGFEVTAELVPAHGKLECTTNPNVHKYTVNTNWDGRSYKYTLTKDFGKSELTPEEQKDFEEATRIAANYAIALAKQTAFRPGSTVGLEYVEDGVTVFIPKGDQLPSRMSELEQQTQKCHHVNDDAAKQFSTIIRTKTNLAQTLQTADLLKPYLKKAEAVPAAPKEAKPSATISTQPAALDNPKSYLCYLNSAFQLLAFPPKIRERLLTEGAIIETTAGNEFKRLLQEYNTGKPLSLETLRKELKFAENKTGNATEARDALIKLISPDVKRELFSTYHSSLENAATLPTDLHIPQGKSFADVLEQFDTAPEVFMPGTEPGKKDNARIENPLEFRLPGKVCSRKNLEVEYETLSGFVWHTGHNHYMTYLRDGDKYWECNDKNITECKKGTFLEKAATGELHLYFKKDHIGSIQYPNATIRVTVGDIVEHPVRRIVNFRKAVDQTIGDQTFRTVDSNNPIDSLTGINPEMVRNALRKSRDVLWARNPLQVGQMTVMNVDNKNKEIVQAITPDGHPEFVVRAILDQAERDDIGSIAFSIPERNDPSKAIREYNQILAYIRIHSSTQIRKNKISLKNIEIVLTEQQKAWIFPEKVTEAAPPASPVPAGNATAPNSSRSSEADDEESGSEAPTPVAHPKTPDDASSVGTNESSEEYHTADENLKRPVKEASEPSSASSSEASTPVLNAG